MQVGDLVRWKGHSLLRPDHLTLGTVVRLPLPPEERRHVCDDRVLMQVGREARPRPVRIEDLQEMGQAGTPLEQIQAIWSEHQERCRKKAEEVQKAFAAIKTPPAA